MRSWASAARWVRRAVGVLVTTALTALVVVLGVSIVPALIGYQSLSIRSGSMEPTIPTGALVLARVERASDVNVGDIVLARHGTAGPGAPPVLHRVIEVDRVAGGVAVRTKGDANRTADPGTYTLTGTAATAAVILPWLGFLQARLTTPAGWLALVVIPAAALCAAQLLRLWWPEPGTLGTASFPAS